MSRTDNRKIEDLINAIATYNGSRDPVSPLYQARNFLCLQEFTREGVATGKLRQFSCSHAGFLSAIDDLKVKCSGRSRAKLHGDNFNLRGLARAYGMQDGSSRYLVRFLRKATGDQTISEDTKLDYFLSEEDKKIFDQSAHTDRTKVTNAVAS